MLVNSKTTENVALWVTSAEKLYIAVQEKHFLENMTR